MRGEFPNLTKYAYTLVSSDDFTAREKLSLRCCGPRSVLNTTNDYVYQIEDLQNSKYDDVHGSRLKFCQESSLDASVELPNVAKPKSRMVVQHSMPLVEDEDELKVQVLLRGFLSWRIRWSRCAMYSRTFQLYFTRCLLARMQRPSLSHVFSQSFNSESLFAKAETLPPSRKGSVHTNCA